MAPPTENGRNDSSSLLSFDAEKIVRELVTTVAQSHTSSVKNNGNQQRHELQQAQLELGHLLQVQDLLAKTIAEKKGQVNDLLLKVSPFSSIKSDENLLAKMAAFQDEASLFELEQAMPELQSHPAFVAQWESLDKARVFKSNSIDCSPRERGIRFLIASQFAAQMEVSGKYHYNPRQHMIKDYPWPDKLYTRQDFLNDFSGFDEGDDPPPTLEFFVRVSYREGDDDDAPTRVLLEGFFSDYSDLDPWDRDCYTVIEVGDDNTHVHMVCNDISQLDDPHHMGLNVTTSWMRKQTIEWPEDAQKAYMQRISLTVLACQLIEETDETPTIHEGDEDEEEEKSTASVDEFDAHHVKTTFLPLLVVTTRGFNSSKDLLAIMPPRSYLAQARKANLLDCVNVGLKPTEEGKDNQLGFRIMIDWGTQDTFTRRRSILDAF